MKIINKKEFLTLPSNTLFSTFEPCIFGKLCIKGDTIGDSGFYVQDISDSVDCDSSTEFAEILIDATEKGKLFKMDFECEDRDGLFEDGSLFAVWDKCDVKQLITRLQSVFAN